MTRRLWLRTRRWLVVASAGAVVVAGLAVGVAITTLRHQPADSSVASVVAHLSNRHAHPPTSASHGDHDALFVGASYTAGLGANPPSAGYAYLIGHQPGWRVQVDGVSGTGFLNPGPHGGATFADRIARLSTRPHPDLVVFQGGRNDVAYPAAQLRAAVIATVDLTRRRFGGAQIVLLGPIPAQVPPPRNQIAVESVLESAARACHATFIDPIAQHWMTVSNVRRYTGHVAAHPDNLGYAYIAARLMPELSALLNVPGGF